jgi:hypothetical protein
MLNSALLSASIVDVIVLHWCRLPLASFGSSVTIGSSFLSSGSKYIGEVGMYGPYKFIVVVFF